MNRETIILTQEEHRRAMVLSKVREGRLQVTQAATVLGLSRRHCLRLLAALRQQGPAALAHGNRGRTPPNRLPVALKRQVLRLAKIPYAGFNHSHLTEQLQEHHRLRVSRQTVSRWLVAAGLPSPRPRRRRRFRRRRERMPQEGLLHQWDASDHDWLEGRGPRIVLQGAIDDATSEVPAALFRPEEDAQGYLVVLRTTVGTKGRPVAIYSDRHRIFQTPATAEPSIDEQLRGVSQPLTQVGRALAELQIRWIPASSPQSKGRIERLWGTFQDRLVSELRRAKARTLEEANAILAAFLPRYNARFAKPAAQSGSAYRPLPADVALDDICCFAYPRTVANDNTVQIDGRVLQLLPDRHRRSYAKARVVVRVHLDGTRSVSYQGRRLISHLLTEHPAPRKPQEPFLGNGKASSILPNKSARSQRRPQSSRLRRRAQSTRRWTPPRDHPWRRSTAQAIRRKLLRAAE